MPDGLLADQLKEDEVRDLIAYLMSASQVPLPESSAENPSELLTGRADPRFAY